MFEAGPRSTEHLRQLDYGNEFADRTRCPVRGCHREESLPPHAVGLCGAKEASSAGLEDVPKTLLDLRGPLPRVSPEEQVLLLPEAPGAGHRGGRKGQ